MTPANPRTALDATIISATLILTGQRTGTSPSFTFKAAPNSSIYQMLVDWSTSDTWNSWNTDHGVTSGIAADGVQANSTADSTFLFPSSSSPYNTSIDVTSSLQAWIGNDDNYGWVILGNNSSAGQYYAPAVGGGSKDYRPILEVIYESVPEPGSIGLLALGGLTLLARRRRRV